MNVVVKNLSSQSSMPLNAAGYDDPDSATITELPILDDESFLEIETESFDPYNSGSFDSTKFNAG